MNGFNRNIGILASGSGTTAEYVIRATQTGVLNAEVQMVISDKEEAGVFDRVGRLNDQYGLGIDVAHFGPDQFPDGATENLYEQTDQESTALCEALEEHDVTLVLLLGYLRKVRGPLLEQFGALPEHGSPYDARMLNTHPGPLPETRGYYGRGVHEKVSELGLTMSAQTLHLVSADYDEGARIASNGFPVYPNDTPEIIEANAQSTEKAHLPSDIESFLSLRETWKANGGHQVHLADHMGG
jgi:phosphoribosylglycinamide formyltransferase-1